MRSRETIHLAEIDLVVRGVLEIVLAIRRRKPSVNHWAKCGKSMVDLDDKMVFPGARSNNCTTASTLGKESGCRVVGGRCRPVKVRSVSESQEV
jgi:hypothetical protein